MILYPYITPQILDDALFVSYGGYTGTATSVMLEAAYSVAELQLSKFFNSFIIPTTVTGTFSFYDPGKFNFEFGGYLSSIDSVTINYNYPGYASWSQVGYSKILNDVYGDVEIYDINGCLVPTLFSATISFTAGLPSQITSLPLVKSVLTKLAQIELNDLYDPSANEGGAGDPGVQGFSAISYSEQRVQLAHTSFGTSARANKILNLLRNIRGSTPALRAR